MADEEAEVAVWTVGCEVEFASGCVGQVVGLLEGHGGGGVVGDWLVLRVREVVLSGVSEVVRCWWS